MRSFVGEDKGHDMNECKIPVDESGMVSEPAVAYGTTAVSDSGQLCREEDFESLWKHSLNVEEFRNRCVAKLRDICILEIRNNDGRGDSEGARYEGHIEVRAF